MSYRYQRSTYRRPPVQLLHTDLSLQFFDDRVEGTETLLLQARESLTQVVLDAADLEIGPATLLQGDMEHPLATFTDKPDHKLTLLLPNAMEAGDTFRIRLSAVCHPSDSLLEGIYRDTTPPGAPPQYISQCQQWGFQRIMPILDDCTAKCTWRTTLEADARYTHLITNGDVDRTTNPDGIPVPARTPGRICITYVNAIPMPPYLFVAGAGTWDMLEDEVTIPGGRKVKLQYLVPPGRREGAFLPMEILKDSVLWQAAYIGYEYKRECYRTICMEKSNFGGMENVGNTTIITEAALLDRWTSDRRLVYAYAVIVHEFEHNHCGSDVTMETPFDMWLNEAFTVTVEQAYLADRFNAAGQRLSELDSLRDPLRGPIAAEDAHAAAPIVREGFDHPDDVVDGVTYQKAPEILGMLRVLIGDDRYREATKAYFRKFDKGNATTEDFLEVFRDFAPDADLLNRFFQPWLFSSGYPKITGSWRYDAAAKRLSVTLRQERNPPETTPFVVPFRIRAVTADGYVIPDSDRLLVLEKPEQEWSFDGILGQPAFLDWNSDGPFYGVFHDASATPETLALSAAVHPSPVGRATAFAALTDSILIRHIENPETPFPVTPGSPWFDAFRALLVQTDLHESVRARMLTVSEDLLDREYLSRALERAQAAEALRRAASAAIGADSLRNAWKSACEAAYAEASRNPTAFPRILPLRALARALGSLYARTGDSRIAADFRAHFDRAVCVDEMADAIRATIAAGQTDAARDLLARMRTDAVHHVSGYSVYLATLGSLPIPDVFDWAEQEENTPEYHPEHPSYARALQGALARNNLQLWTPRGLQWLEEALLRMAPVNENVPILVMGAVQNVRSFRSPLRETVRALLKRVQTALPDIAPEAHALAARIRDALKE